jgi:hypothetical protein
MYVQYIVMYSVAIVIFHWLHLNVYLYDYYVYGTGGIYKTEQFHFLH